MEQNGMVVKLEVHRSVYKKIIRWCHKKKRNLDEWVEMIIRKELSH